MLFVAALVVVVVVTVLSTVTSSTRGAAAVEDRVVFALSTTALAFSRRIALIQIKRR